MAFEVTWFSGTATDGTPINITFNPLLYFLWCIWVGWIFSTVGAFGGIMAGFGHITVLGIRSAAAALKGKYVTIPGRGEVEVPKYVGSDMIRAANSALTLINGLTTVLGYYIQKRLVWPAGIYLGLGMVIGAQLAVLATAGMPLKQYVGYFGLAAFAVSIFMFNEISPWMAKRKRKAKEIAQKFYERVKELKAQGRLHELEGIKNMKVTLKAVEFDFFGEHFRVPSAAPFLWGLIVGFIAAMIGVGGGFLLVPFLTLALQLPMYIAPSASALGVFLNMISAILGWTLIKKVIIPAAVIIGMIGIVIGAMIGPRTQKYLPMKLLYIIFGVLSFYVGLRYIMLGFFGIKLPP